MSDYYSIQEIGGADLARHYPDRGLMNVQCGTRNTHAASGTSLGWRHQTTRCHSAIPRVHEIEVANAALSVFVDPDLQLRRIASQARSPFKGAGEGSCVRIARA
jgi:hypothetical protein